MKFCDKCWYKIDSNNDGTQLCPNCGSELLQGENSPKLNGTNIANNVSSDQQSPPEAHYKLTAQDVDVLKDIPAGYNNGITALLVIGVLALLIGAYMEYQFHNIIGYIIAGGAFGLMFFLIICAHLAAIRRQLQMLIKMQYNQIGNRDEK